MAADMQRELEATRTELRRGILELPQETADSAAQMRRVIVDQIEALAELNRIVARHGRGLDAAEPARRGQQEPVAARRRRRWRRPRSIEVPPPRRRLPPRRRAATSPAWAAAAAAPRRSAVAQPGPGPANNGRSGWLSELLHRASRPEDGAPEERAAARRRRAAAAPHHRVARTRCRSTSRA